jgi:tRNA modification GTPase
MKCLAHCEAVIDFGDDDREDDVNDSVMWQLLPKVKALKKELGIYINNYRLIVTNNFYYVEIHLNDGKKGELVREGIKIALIGPPNAGKSSLLNALAKRPAAIVSPIAGTTR